MFKGICYTLMRDEKFQDKVNLIKKRKIETDGGENVVRYGRLDLTKSSTLGEKRPWCFYTLLPIWGRGSARDFVKAKHITQSHGNIEGKCILLLTPERLKVHRNLSWIESPSHGHPL